ncbi:MAG: BatD family protein [Planctomycetota bacterium]|jgi:hypothetical protein
MAIIGNHTRASRLGTTARAAVLAAALCAWSAGASGATVSIKVNPITAELGEAVTLVVSVDDDASPVRVALPKGVRIAAGPSTSQKIMQDLTRGTYSRATEFRYTLAFDAPGTYSLGPATVRVGRRTFKGGSGRVVVKKQGSRKDVRVFASLKPERAYVGQPVTATFSYCETREVADKAFAVPFLADVDGLKSEDPEGLADRWNESVKKTRRGLAGHKVVRIADPPAQVVARLERRRIGDADYIAHTVRRVLIPEKTGTYDLGRASAVAVVVTGHRWVRDFMGFRRKERVTKRIALSSEPLSLEVLEVPAEGRPAGYAGAIGTYELVAEASPREVALGGDPVALTLTVRGEGDIETVPLPCLADDTGWRVGTVEQKQETSFEKGRPVGERRFTLPLRPRSAEVAEIPAAELAVFDPVKETYVTLRTEPIPVRVTVPEDSGALEGVALPEAARARIREREELKQDIEDIETQVDAAESDAAWLHGPAGLVTFFALPLAAYAAASVVARRRRELQENAALARRLSAAKAARAGLARLRDEAASLPPADFAEAVAKALHGYLADRLDRPGGEIPPDEAERLLAESGVDAGLSSEAAEVLREAGAARFGGGGGEPGELLRRAEACVEAIEKGGAS